MLTALVGLGLGLLARAWLFTLRVRVVTHSSLDVASPHPWVLALWHGQLLSLLAHRRRRRTVALVSWSRDGETLAWAMRWFGVSSERGSGSRGGKEGLEAVMARMREGWDAAFAVDGPRGPKGVARPGALAAARDARGLVVPYAAACSRTIVLRTWDRFEIPLPFSSVVVVLGAPLPRGDGVEADVLAARIDTASLLAQEIVTGESRAKLKGADCRTVS
jgi:lysophospholipid acyltransferase (LPLAT)-like uncharacterized protein